MLAHSLDMTLLDKCSEAIIPCLELKISHRKVEVLFYSFN